MTMSKGRYIIGTLWIGGFVVLFLLLMLETINGSVYGKRADEAWGWFTPNILPTVLLIIGVIIAESQKTGTTGDEKVNSYLIIATLFFSVLHLSTMLIVMLISSYEMSVEEAFQPLKMSGLPLGALQGLVTLTLGIFFRK